MSKENNLENKDLTATFGNTMLYDVFISKMIGVDADYDDNVFKDSKSRLRYIIHNRDKSEGLLFNSDWNWLMCVVDFINSRDWVTIYRDECKIHALLVGEFEDIKIVNEEEPLINIVYRACGIYAKWYVENIV